jgi:hypothetical protein
LLVRVANINACLVRLELPDGSDAQQWDDIARDCYPGCNDTRTRMTVVHGPQDLAVLYSLLGVKLTQWSNVLVVSFTKNMTSTPAQSRTEMVYEGGSKLLGFCIQEAGHIPPFQEETVLKFCGIM